MLPFFFMDQRRLQTFVDKWIKDNVIHFPEVEFIRSVEDLKR